MNSLVRLSLSTKQIDEEKQKNIKLGAYMICFDKLVGKGAYSDVYICKDTHKNIAAVKIISKEKNNCEQAVKIAKTQAKILKKLRHDHVVRYIDSYESSRNFYLILQYYQGRTLKQLIDSKLILNNVERLNIISQLIGIMRYLHHKSIAHRDLKPENLKYSRTNQLVVLDFGFAKDLQNGESTIMTDWVGTPTYMSPQMLSRLKYTSKTDIWSLGIIIYEIIFNQVPWRGSNESDLLSNIKKKEIDFPKKPKISQTVKQLIKCCLKINPAQRISWKQLFIFDNSKILKQAEEDQKKCKFCCY